MTIQYGACLLHAGKTMLHARMHMYTPTRPATHTHTHARVRTHAYANTHAHAEKYLIFIAFPRRQWV